MTKIKVLYAEDEKIVADSVTRMLSKVCDVTYVKNGDEALKTFKKNKNYDVIVTDIRMPVMDGLEMLQGIKDIGYTPYSVIISAYNETAYLLKGIELSVNKFLIKPLNVEDLINIILEQQALLTHKDELIEQNNLKNSKKNIDIPNQTLIDIIPLPTLILHNKEILYQNKLFNKQLEVNSISKDDVISSINDLNIDYNLMDSIVDCKQIKIDQLSYTIKYKMLNDENVLILLI